LVSEFAGEKSLPDRANKGVGRVELHGSRSLREITNSWEGGVPGGLAESYGKNSRHLARDCRNNGGSMKKAEGCWDGEFISRK